jgi:hypothetical protein
MVSPNAKKPVPITSAAGASLGLMLGTAAEYQKTLLFLQHNLIRRLRAITDEALQQLQLRFNRFVCQNWATVDLFQRQVLLGHEGLMWL